MLHCTMTQDFSSHILKRSCFLMPLSLVTCFFYRLAPAPPFCHQADLCQTLPVSHLPHQPSAELAHSQPGIINHSSFFPNSPPVTLIKYMHVGLPHYPPVSASPISQVFVFQCCNSALLRSASRFMIQHVCYVYCFLIIMFLITRILYFTKPDCMSTIFTNLTFYFFKYVLLAFKLS